jgi:uncharacterized membrane protein YphA (DoxX/SURF4 family)
MSVFKRTCAAAFAVLCLIVAAVSFSGAASAYPPGSGNPDLTTTTTTVVAGGDVPLVGSNYSGDGSVDLTFHSTVVNLGDVSTDSAGGFTATIKVPADAALGTHHIVGTDNSTGKYAEVEITVVASQTGAASGSSGSGKPGSTGVAVVGLATVGVVLLVGGGLMLLAGRRRKVLV